MPPSRGAYKLYLARGLVRPTASKYKSDLFLSHGGSQAISRSYSALASRTTVSSSLLSRPVFGSERSHLSPRSNAAFTFQTRTESTRSSGADSVFSASPFASKTSVDVPEIFDDAGILPSDLAASPKPDHIGFLREDFGIDFGWGTSSLAQYIFEHIHVYLTPEGVWWTSILGLVLAFRGFMFVPQLMAADNSARAAAVNVLLKPRMEAMKEAMVSGNQLEATKLRKEMRDINQGAGVKMYKYALPLMQLPLGFGCWRLMRNLPEVGIPGLETGGPLWFSNLAVADPYFILPIANGIMNFFTLRLSQSRMTLPDPRMEQIQKVMVYGLPCLFVSVFLFAPSTVQLYFAASSACGLATNVILESNVVRQLVGIPPKPPKSTPSASSPVNPYKGTITVAGRGKSIREGTLTEMENRSKRGLAQSLTNFRPLKSMKETFAKQMPKAQERLEKKKSENLKRKAWDYEAKRQREIEDERTAFKDEIEGRKSRSKGIR